MSSLSAYLAKNYLNASSDPRDQSQGERPKKRRKKDKSGIESTLLIADDDEDLSLSKSGSSRRMHAEGEDDGLDEGAMMYEGRSKSAEFRRKKASGWKTVSEPQGDLDTGGTGLGEAGATEADKILADAAAAQDERRKEIEMEDAPAIVSDQENDKDDHTGSGMRMESGVKAGLQTAADTARIQEQEERKRRAEAKKEKARRNERKEQPGDARALEEQETIYRDATGRRIDISMKRAEARQKEIEKAREEQKRKEEAMGDVQRRMKEEKKIELEEAKFLTIGRSADDEEMNDRLKDVLRWDDPMAQYMATKRAEEESKAVRASGGRKAGGGGGGVVVRKKVYQGSAAPNRYGILPGWRWDGVDRGNGFEKEWFQARSRRSRNEELAYQWQMDE